MLAHIDQLYNSLLQKRADPAAAPMPPQAPSSAPTSDARRAQGIESGSAVTATPAPARAADVTSRGIDVTRCAPSKDKVDRAKADPRTDDHDQDGEALLANIDQLYNDLMHGDSRNGTDRIEDKSGPFPTAVAEEAAAVLLPQAASGPEVQELSTILEK